MDATRPRPAEKTVEVEVKKELRPLFFPFEVPIESERLEIYRCDFVANNIRTLQLKLVAVRDGEVLDLGAVDVSALSSPNRGSMYVAYVARGGDESGISRLLACGIAAKSSRRATPIGKFSFEGYSYRGTFRPADSYAYLPDKETIIWGVRYQKTNEDDQPKTLQELVSDLGPFADANLNPEQVISKAKAMKDTITVIAIASGRS